MVKSEKRMETVVKSIADLQKKIKADSERLKKLQAEYEELTAKKITDFAKKNNLQLTDHFFEMLSFVSHMEEEGIKIDDLETLFSHPEKDNSEESIKEDVNDETD